LEGKREEKIEVNRRRGRKLKQLLEDLKEKRWYWKLTEEIQVALSGELALQEVVDVSEGRLCMELSMLDVWLCAIL
jgi:hypothetical protein